MKDVFRQFFSYLFTPLTITLWFVTSVTTAIAGPFGTFQAFAIPHRFLFWMTIVAVGISASFFARRVASGVTSSENTLGHNAITTIIVTSVLTPVVWSIAAQGPRSDMVAMPTPAMLYFYVFLVVICVVILRRIVPPFHALFGGKEASEGAPEHPLNDMVQPRLANRLSATAQGQIIRLTVRDHFVEVVTTQGIETLRMRFGDAVNEMEPVQGICTHRSHWVVFDKVSGVVKNDSGKGFVEMINGDLIPISRTYRPGLERAGYL